MDRSDVLAHLWATFDEGRLVLACAWCGRVLIDDSWLVAPQAAFVAIDSNALSHSICGTCAASYPSG
jgi:hypothetical protein